MPSDSGPAMSWCTRRPRSTTPADGVLPYVASKATLVGIARTLARPLGAHGITAAITGQTLCADGGSVFA